MSHKKPRSTTSPSRPSDAKTPAKRPRIDLTTTTCMTCMSNPGTIRFPGCGCPYVQCLACLHGLVSRIMSNPVVLFDSATFAARWSVPHSDFPSTATCFRCPACKGGLLNPSVLFSKTLDSSLLLASGEPSAAQEKCPYCNELNTLLHVQTCTRRFIPCSMCSHKIQINPSTVSSIKSVCDAVRQHMHTVCDSKHPCPLCNKVFCAKDLDAHIRMHLLKHKLSRLHDVVHAMATQLQALSDNVSAASIVDHNQQLDRTMTSATTTFESILALLE